MKKTVLCLLVLFLSITSSQAQTHIGISGQLGIPLNEFRDNTDAIGGGFRANLFFPFSQGVPVFIGLDVGYMIYGTNTQFINEDIEIVALGQVIDRIPLRLDVTTNNNLLDGYVVLRAKAPLSIVQPYVDGLIGLNYLYTRTRITETGNRRILTDPNGDNVVSASTQINSIAFSYGGAVGFMLRIADNINLDLRAAYLFGGEAEYYDGDQTNDWQIQFSGSSTFDPNNIDQDDIELSNPSGTPKSSRTDKLSVNLGVSLSF